MTDVVVIGSGLAGLVAAIKLGRAGKSVTLISKGLGGLQLSQGTVDVLGYNPDRVTDPVAASATMPSTHPYSVLGADAVRAGVLYVQDVLKDHLVGDPARNVFLPTAVGALRPTCLVPPTMAAGIVTGGIR